MAGACDEEADPGSGARVRGLVALLTAGCLWGAEFAPAPRIGIVSQREITLQEAIALVLANDKDIASSRILREEASYNIAGANGAYDTRVGLNGHWFRQVNPISSLIGGGPDGKLTNTELLGDPYISGALPWLGTTFKLDLSSARQTSDSTFLTLNPQFPTSLNLNVTQPLWRGLRFDDNRHRIAVAKKNKSLTDEQFRQRVIEVITQASQAYWDLDYAVRDYQSQLDAVKLAEQQKESNQRQVVQGVLAPIDVIAADTQVSTFEQQFYQAQSTLTRAENSLKQLMLGSRSDVMWPVALVPVTKVERNYAIGTIEDAVGAALKKRPEVSEAHISSEVNALDTRLYKELTKPQMDLVGTFSSAGLAGRLEPPGPNPLTGSFQPLIDRINALSVAAGFPVIDLSTGTTLPPNLVGGYAQSLTNLADGRYPTVSVGMQLSFPIRNRTAKANLSSSVAEGKRLKNQQELVELMVVADVRNSVQSLVATQARLDAAGRAQGSAEEQYASEQRQFKAGTSTLFLVLQRQTDMIAARSRELRAQADVGRAIADLERATGEALKKRQIELK